eukprot:3137053-Rhodomonas_salina.2
MREDKKRRRDVGPEQDSAARHHVGAELQQGASSSTASDVGNALGAGSAAAAAGAGRFRVELGPDGQQVSNAQGFPILKRPSAIPRELLTGHYAALWESADRPLAFLASGELGFLHQGSGGGVKPATTGTATQTGAEALCLRSGSSITTPQLHREEHVWGGLWLFDPRTGEPVASNVDGSARLQSMQARIDELQAELAAVLAREHSRREAAAHALLSSEDSEGPDGGGE